jgi:hypothetical protein
LCHFGDINAPDGGRIPRIPPDTTAGYPRIPPLDIPRYHALDAHCRWLGGTDSNADNAKPRARGTFCLFCVSFDNRVAACALNGGHLWAFTVRGARLLASTRKTNEGIPNTCARHLKPQRRTWVSCHHRILLGVAQLLPGACTRSDACIPHGGRLSRKSGCGVRRASGRLVLPPKSHRRRHHN